MMILITILLVLAVVATAYIASIIKNMNGKAISFRESMDLANLPVVTFRNHDRKLNFLLDTGSNVSYINKSMLDSVDHELIDKNAESFGIEGIKVNNPFCKMKVGYKNLEFNEEFCIADLDCAFSTVKQESGVQIHGILGSKFFEKYKYILDFKELRAYIV